MATIERVAPGFRFVICRPLLRTTQRLGFATREYVGGGYGFITRDNVEIHLGVVAAVDNTMRSTRATCSSTTPTRWPRSGSRPESTCTCRSTPNGVSMKAVVVDPDGNVIRFGSPMNNTHH